MGWLFSREYKSKQDVLDHVRDDIARAGYRVETSGSWLYAEKDGKPVDLIYILTEKIEDGWGHKEISVSAGPTCCSAPLYLVLKVHPIFKNDEFYKGWLKRYPKRKQVFESEA